jgi:hypothetical protein
LHNSCWNAQGSASKQLAVELAINGQQFTTNGIKVRERTAAALGGDAPVWLTLRGSAGHVQGRHFLGPFLLLDLLLGLVSAGQLAANSRARPDDDDGCGVTASTWCWEGSWPSAPTISASATATRTTVPDDARAPTACEAVLTRLWRSGVSVEDG